MMIVHLRRHLVTTGLALCCAAGLVLSGPAAAIQNIGFPDDQSLTIDTADLAQYQTAHKAMLQALATLQKYGGVEGEVKDRGDALDAITRNAQIIQTIAKRAGNSDIATFMGDLAAWSKSGDRNDHSPELIKQIQTSLKGLKVKNK